MTYYTDDGKDANVWTYALSRAESPRQLTFQHVVEYVTTLSSEKMTGLERAMKFSLDLP